MELNDVMRTTFSAREYTGEPLSDEALFDILDNARYAPSGGNRQGARIIVVRAQETRALLSELARPAATRYTAQIAAGEVPWNPLRPTKVTPVEISQTDPRPTLIEPFREASVVLVFTLDLGVVAATDQDLDRIGVIAGASIYPLVWNVLLGARQAGFGGTISTMAVAKEPEVKELLGVPDDHAICAVVPLGKPRKQLTSLRRHSVAGFVTRERYDGEHFALS